MKVFWAGVVILALLVVGPFTAHAQGMYGRDEAGYSGEEQGYGGDQAAAGPTYYGAVKTQEQVAWDLLMWGLKNIPDFPPKIKSYEDFLEAYRQALLLVKDPRKPGTVR